MFMADKEDTEEEVEVEERKASALR